MKCPKCNLEMVVKRQEISHDSDNKKQYDRIVYWCESDDIWINLETPKKSMENKEEIKQRISKGGFIVINEYNDPSNEFFPDHDHPGDQLLVVVSGSIEVTMNGKTSVLEPGDEMFFPARIMHSAKVGPGGCQYIDGERPVVREIN